MTVLAITSQVLFLHPFRLSAMEQSEPAGLYRITIRQQRVDGDGFVATVTLAVLLQLPALGQWSADIRHVTTDSNELAACVAADRACVQLRLVASRS